jgi:hypothetical protein
MTKPYFYQVPKRIEFNCGPVFITWSRRNSKGGLMKFKKRPVVIEATQWFKNGDHPQDECRVIVPAPGDGEPFLSEGKVVQRYQHPSTPDNRDCKECGKIMHLHRHGWIDTKEGGHIVCPGDWVITGVKGERYPCKPDIFSETYDPVTETEKGSET